MYTQKEMLKEVRKKAAIMGLTFKASNSRYNGAPLFKLTVRTTGRVLIDNYLLSTAFMDSQYDFEGLGEC
mgnify:CR=1 FL=1